MSTSETKVERVIFEFPNKDTADEFLAWFCDGGGEDSFLTVPDTEIMGFNYSKCFEAWGYDPERDGEPVVIAES